MPTADVSTARIERALISVSDKLGLVAFAKGLVAAGIEIYSTGGTRQQLESEGIPTRDVAEYTGFPEMMDGRIKTLHPKVHGGILFRRDLAEHQAAAQQHQILAFDLVVVNLYPFESTVARAGVTDEEAIEQIDIGGPSLIRGAAKNHAFVTVATSSEQYAEILAQITANGNTTKSYRRKLAGEAFASTARYDQAIAAYFARGGMAPDDFPPQLQQRWQRKSVLRYGENPHQQAALYAEDGLPGANLVSAHQLNGKELSYNNLLDLDSALGIVRQLSQPAVSVVKHNNPCGAAEGTTLAVAARAALDGDPQSAFGGVLGLNRPVDAATAEVLVEPGRFIEAIVAPAFEPAALEILTTRPKWKANVRLLEVGTLNGAAMQWDYRRLDGGLLVQTADTAADPEADWKVVSATQPTEQQWADLRFAWSLVRFVKSNAIVVAKQQMLHGVGAGQMSRVDSVQIALSKAGEQARGAALGSDAFFPFADSIHAAAAAGITAAIQPGGSRNDEEVIAACNQHGIALVFTGRRHFRH